MKNYPADKIRNIVLLGHGGSGKTAFAEAVLYNAKATDRLGRSADGNTVMDFDPEEIRRKISINTSVATCEWRDCKINLIDTPGDFDFLGEVMQGLRVADSALVLISAKDGNSVGAEKAVRLSKKRNVPIFFMISRMDEANANFDKALESLQERYGAAVTPFALPIVADGKMTGVVDVIAQQAYSIDPKTGATKPIDMPASLKGTVESLVESISEHAAESDEALMEKFFGGEPFTSEELLQGLRASIKSGSLMPVFVGAVLSNWAIGFTLDKLADYMPSPAEMPAVTAETTDGASVTVDVKDSAFSSFIFKTIADPFVGRISLFRVYSGVLKGNSTVYNPVK